MHAFNHQDDLGWLEQAPCHSDPLTLCTLRMDQALRLALRHHPDESPYYLANTACPFGGY